MRVLGEIKTLAMVAVVGATTIMSADAFAHARFKPGSVVSPPRNPGTLGSTRAPCGREETRTATPTQLVAGSQVMVEFEETRPHNGFFQIAFSPANDQGFEQNILVTNIVDVGNPQNDQPVGYSQMITVPDTPCDACTLQMKFDLGGGDYYSCSDIQIVAAAENQAPNAVIVSQYTEAKAPVTVAFDGSTSTDDAAIVSHLWDFGDGSTATEATVSHEFTTPGDYTVTLTTTDAEGLSGTASVEIRALAEEPAITAVLASDAFSGKVPLIATISGKDSVLAADYSWSIDGQSESAFDGLSEIKYTFREPGLHVVALTVTDAEGGTDTKTININAQQDVNALSPKAFARVMLEDFSDLDGNRDNELTFSDIKDSFLNTQDEILEEIDLNSSDSLNTFELKSYLGEDTTGDPGAQDNSLDESPSSSSNTAAGSTSLLMLLLAGLLSAGRRRV